MEPSGARLGAMLGHLGPSWSDLEPSWGHVWAVWGLSKDLWGPQLGNEEGTNNHTKIIGFSMIFASRASSRWGLRDQLNCLGRFGGRSWVPLRDYLEFFGGRAPVLDCPSDVVLDFGPKSM